MPDLGAYTEKVQFDWEGAKKLATEFRAMAQLLEDQIQPRNTYATNARKHWKGKFAVEFDGRMTICIGDAKKFMTALRETALKVDELAKLARAEQRRRDLAKEYIKKHDEWKRKRDERNDVMKFLDGLDEKVGLKDSGEPKPPDPPKEPTRYTIPPPQTTGRTGSGGGSW